MKHVSKEKVEYVSPDVEVIVRAGDQELAAIAFFRVGDGSWDVLVGINSPSRRASIAAVLRGAADATEQAAFSIRAAARDEDNSDIPKALDDFPF